MALLSYDSFYVTFSNLKTGARREVRFSIQKDALSQKWAGLLRDILSTTSHLEKNYLLHGWLKGSRDLNFLCQELNRHIAIINQFFAVKPAGLFYHIPLHFDPATVDQNILNLIHHDFELLIGQVWDPSPYFGASSELVRHSIRQLNNLCHESEAILSAQKNYAQRHCSSAIIASLYPRACQDLTAEEKQQSQLFFNFGDVRLHYSQLGKTHLEAFYAQDEIVHDKNVTELRYLTGEFDICLNSDSSDEYRKETELKMKAWLKNKGLSTEGPFGFPLVATLDRSQFHSPEPFEILTELFEYDDICRLAVSRGETLYSKDFPYSWIDQDFEERQRKYVGAKLGLLNRWMGIRGGLKRKWTSLFGG